MCVIYHEDELKDYLMKKMNDGMYFGFVFLCEEITMCYKTVQKQWDLIGRNDRCYYFVELKTSTINEDELDYMDKVGTYFRSFNNIKVVLITPGWSEKEKDKVSKYKNIMYYELEHIQHVKGMSHLSSYKENKCPNTEYDIDAIRLFSYIDPNNFDYYIGVNFIDNNYMVLNFKINENYGIAIKYERHYNAKHELWGQLYYQIIYYKTSYYNEVIKTYSYIIKEKLNTLFQILKNSDFESNYQYKLFERLNELDDEYYSRYFDMFTSLNSKK